MWELPCLLLFRFVLSTVSTSGPAPKVWLVWRSEGVARPLLASRIDPAAVVYWQTPVKTTLVSLLIRRGLERDWNYREFMSSTAEPGIAGLEQRTASLYPASKFYSALT